MDILSLCYEKNKLWIRKYYLSIQTNKLSLCLNQGGRGHWIVNYISTQSQMRWLNLGTFIKF